MAICGVSGADCNVPDHSAGFYFLTNAYSNIQCQDNQYDESFTDIEQLGLASAEYPILPEFRTLFHTLFDSLSGDFPVPTSTSGGGRLKNLSRYG